MSHLQDVSRRVAGDTRGGIAIEYALIAALVGIGILGGVRALGSGDASIWANSAARLINAMQGG
jgi:Flp pilus assembly pilin Flp